MTISLYSWLRSSEIESTIFGTTATFTTSFETVDGGFFFFFTSSIGSVRIYWDVRSSSQKAAATRYFLHHLPHRLPCDQGCDQQVVSPFVVASNTGYSVSLHDVAFFLNVVDVAFFVFMFVVLCYCCKKWCVWKMDERRKGSAKGNLISTTTSICRRSHSRGRVTATAASAVAYITNLFDALQGRRFAFC